MPGPLIADPTPDWLKPENASVTDSALTKAMRMMAHVIGADNPSAQVFNWMTTELPGGEVQGGIAKAMEGLKGRVQNAIKAYHGSPHDFEQFSLSKIGTGEGAQAYGHGLYFAENPETAQAYKKQLEYMNHEIAGKRVYGTESHAHSFVKEALDSGGTIDDAIQMGESYLKNMQSGPGKSYQGAKDATAALAQLREWKAASAVKAVPGKMYEVAIHADPEDFLDWDKPLSQQSEKVQKAIGQMPPTTRDKIQRELSMTESSGGYVPGNYLHRELVKETKSAPQASALLREAGIPGIKYLDQGSRAPNVTDERLHNLVAQHGGDVEKAVDQLMQSVYDTPAAKAKMRQTLISSYQPITRNYVVFDDKLIDIRKKYAALLAAGLSAEEAHRQATK